MSSISPVGKTTPGVVFTFPGQGSYSYAVLRELYTAHPQTAPYFQQAHDIARELLKEAAAAKIILDGVKAERWRILVGKDAEKIDRMVREAPERAYEADFFQTLAKEGGWKLGAN
jgi:malonyl CoA-acyl carrier protein transacylase